MAEPVACSTQGIDVEDQRGKESQNKQVGDDGGAAIPSEPDPEPSSVAEAVENGDGENPASASLVPRQQTSELPEATAEAPAIPKRVLSRTERLWGAVHRRGHLLPKPVGDYALRQLDDFRRERSEQRARKSDSADNEKTRLPEGESVLTPEVWVARGRSMSASSPSRCLPSQAPASIVVGTVIVVLLKWLCQNCFLRLKR